jgi:hypothetical protein
MFNQTDFDRLATAQPQPGVTIYVPTYRAGRQQEDRIRFKNAVSQASEKLQQRFAFTEPEAEALLQRAAALVDDPEFWGQQSDGLVVFVAADHFSHYTCPINFEPMVYVMNEFYLRPLVPLLSGQSTFHLLALSRGAVKLYTATEYSITEVDLSGLVPQNMDAALMQDTPDANLGRAGGAENQRGSDNQVYFGRGGQTGDEVPDLKTYFDRVDAGVSDYLCDDKAPLLLGGVDELIPIYREANSYAHLYAEGHVSGNLENEGPGMLHEKAWAVIGGHFREQALRDYKLYGDNQAAGEAGSDLETIIPAAVNGRIAALWLDRERHAYGSYDATNNGVTILTDAEKNARELFNLAAVSAHQSGARVYNVESGKLPDNGSGMCAIYRYTVESELTNL